MPKNTLRIPFKYSEPRFCRDCKTEVKKKDVFAGRAKEIDETTCICAECLLHPKIESVRIEAQPKAKAEVRQAPAPKAKVKTVADNEMFINMMAAALDDQMIRERIIFFARLGSYQRSSMIDSLSTVLRMQGKKPALLASALECLKDDSVALKAIEMLTKK